MLKLGELMTKVDRLTDLSEKHGDKIDDLSHKVTFVKGALWVIGGLLALTGILFAAYLSGKLSITYTPAP